MRVEKIDLNSALPSTLLSLDNLNISKKFDIFNLESKDSDKVVIFGTFLGQKLIGQIACYVYPLAKEAIVASFSVLPVFRHKGIGTLLMQTLVNHLSKSIHLLNLQYNNFEETALFLKKILKKTGWSEPQLLTRRYFFNQYSFHPDWYFSAFPLLPKNFRIYPWIEMTRSALEIAQNWVRANPMLAQYSPFNSDFSIDPITSLCLYKNGQLAGWIINHRIKPKQLRYSAFYLIPEIRGQSPAICLLRESIRLHLKNEIDVEGVMEINFKFSSHSWLRFIENRLAPFAFKTEDIFYAFASFNNLMRI